MASVASEMDKITAPYGSWKSPISAELVSASGKNLEGFGLDSNGHLLWLESRPSESGYLFFTICFIQTHFFKLKLMKIRRISYVGFLGLGDWWLLGKQRKQGMNPLILPQKISLCALLFKNMVVGLLEFLGNCWFFLILMIKDFTNSFSALKVISLLLICFLFVFVMCMLLLYFPCPETRAHFYFLLCITRFGHSQTYILLCFLLFFEKFVFKSPWQTLVCVKRSEEFDTFSFWMEY